MPTTYREVQSKNPEFGTISDPEWNIASGIYYDRQLWQQWDGEASKDYQRQFMFGSYNAGRGTMRRAQSVARERALDPQAWDSIETVAPTVPRWRHKETLGYVGKIQDYIACMDDSGRVIRDRPAPTPSVGAP